jgi:hypothetical protein
MIPLMIFCFAAAVGFAIGYLRFGRQMIRGTKKEFADRSFANRLNIGFYPSMLTEDGLRARRWFHVCMAGVPVSILLGLLFGGVFRNLW